MRRSIAGALVLLSGLVLAALAAGGAGADSPNSFVVGSGSGHFQESGGPFHLSVSAQGEGADATGHVRGTGDNFGEFQVEGPVTCVNVVGNRASIKYRFKHASGSAAQDEGGGVQVYVEDNGNPVNGQPVDRVATEVPLPPEAFNPLAGVCTDPTLVPTWTPIESGNYVVHDAP